MVSNRIRILLVMMILLMQIVLIFGNAKPIAAADKQRIYDVADILSEKERSHLEKVAHKFSKKRETDFIIVTVEDEEKDLQLYMDDFYDEEAFGYNKADGETAMIGIDVGVEKRDVVLSGYKMEESLSPDRLDQIRGKVTPYLYDGEYAKAFELFIETSSDYMVYRPGVNPENPFYKTSIQFLLALVLGAIIVFLLARNVKTRATTTSATYRDDEQTKVLQRRDQYLRTTVKKRHRPKQSKSGGGGSGGIGRTSGGHSRSSSRGKF